MNRYFLGRFLCYLSPLGMKQDYGKKELTINGDS